MDPRRFPPATEYFVPPQVLSETWLCTIRLPDAVTSIPFMQSPTVFPWMTLLELVVRMPEPEQ